MNQMKRCLIFSGIFFCLVVKRLKNEPKEGGDSSFHLEVFSFIIGRIENKMG
ncbi:Hypothetical protein FORC57_1076 [Listeria monocytogenes]|jgi:hypothetical protein|nr:hypothetical protein M642_03025 [Listeria monocytogenes]AHJ05569.1 hypothetical protein AX10_13930 [Listeria monocytogenes WSLC1001]EEW14169.1 predicted protein [Listeria monocytogenes FSL N3-165]EEW21279.1 predicted protein [Listeria monocytogenes F6900]EFF98041.1 predicted protein [Listeria monocytogenes J2818]EUJ20515.1 hypothetical protein G161_08229 [Listeria monocytogenes FSL F6-684]EZH68993.1 hypothetical protein T283_02450 [Listeria monocytogenes N53-1]KHK08646.1 hypothetical prot